MSKAVTRQPAGPARQRPHPHRTRRPGLVPAVARRPQPPAPGWGCRSTPAPRSTARPSVGGVRGRARSVRIRSVRVRNGGVSSVHRPQNAPRPSRFRFRPCGFRHRSQQWNQATPLACRQWMHPPRIGLSRPNRSAAAECLVLMLWHCSPTPSTVTAPKRFLAPSGDPCHRRYTSRRCATFTTRTTSTSS